MEAIDQAQLNFSPTVGLAVAVMVGFLVFAVALDLTWAKLRRVLESPKAPAIGLIAQFIILPAVAFGVGMLMAVTPSIALGLLLVTCCPGGALSNYLTGVARGDVATSVSMTTVSTLFSIIVTPLLFAFWASMNPDTRAVLQEINMDPRRVVMTLFIMLIIPVGAGMLIRAKRPDTADKIRVWTRRIAGLVFATVVGIIIGGNIKVLASFAKIALLPVILTFAVAVALGWGLARLSRLMAADRRAVAIEVAFQNVALAIGMSLAFFPSLAGVAVTSILWGVTHLTLGFALAAVWMRVPVGPTSRSFSGNGARRRSPASAPEASKSSPSGGPEHFHTVVIGGGQCGLATAYHLSRAGVDFVVLEAGERLGHTWRNRWDSLRLFTPTRYSTLPELEFPAASDEKFYLPTKDEMADYLESYAAHFSLPVRLRTKVQRLHREGTYVITANDDLRIEADNVVVTSGYFTKPTIPPFAGRLDPSIVQFHSREYRNPGQLNDGDVLVVGAATSGCEIGIELAKSRHVYVSGRRVGAIPRRILGINIWWLFPFIAGAPTNTPIGRKLQKKISAGGWPLIRFTYEEVEKAGVELVPRVTGVRDGKPELDDGRVLDVKNVIWATGYKWNYASWIDLPIFSDDGRPREKRGVVTEERGIYFVGIAFQHSESSALIAGAGRDSKYVVEALLRRSGEARAGFPAEVLSKAEGDRERPFR